MSYDRGATQEDLVWLYRMILGREPGPSDPMEMRLGLPLVRLVSEFIHSGECRHFMLGPLQRGGVLNEGRLLLPPAEGVAWLADALAVETEAREILLQADSWAKIFDTVLNSPKACAQYNLAEPPLLEATAMALLHSMAHFPQYFSRMGAVEEIMPGAIRGWSVDPQDPDRPSTVQLWVDGEFLAAAPAERFRRDVQDRFGGQGFTGFLIELPGGLPDHRAHRVEIRDGLSGRCLWVQDRPAKAGGHSTGLLALKDELQQARNVLTRLEQRLRDEERLGAESLEDYSDYFERVYRHAAMDIPHLSRQDERLVVVDVEGCDHGHIEQALLSLSVQVGVADWSVAIIHADERQKLWVTDVINRIGWGGGRLKPFGAEIFAEDTDDLVDRLADDAVVILAPAQGYCAPQALAWLSSGLEDQAVQAVYADEDHLVEGPEDYGQRRHCQPVFKPDFDPDLLLQQPYVGGLVALRAQVLKRLGLWAQEGLLAGPALLLALGLEGQAVHHVGRVLYSRFSAQDWQDKAAPWAVIVEKALAADTGITVSPFADPVGVQLDGAVKIQRRFVGTATIIIPTRNGRELLEPCIDSILAARGANQARAEILIIDHQSDEPQTLAYLEELRGQEGVRILPYTGEFNWALMNNLAAAQCQSDVLVFLNNDTLVLSPDWLDALCAQAVRPEVGVVGARLLYQDGRIQHAGFVWREEVAAFLLHEGVRDLASDGGYLGRHALTHAAIAVTGACMAVARQTFEALGGFDAANFPVEGNDVDLCLRAWAKGLRVIYTPSATLYHLESISRGFSRDGEKLIVARRANDKLRARWQEGGRVDPWYNSHFSREAVPFRRLRTPR